MGYFAPPMSKRDIREMVNSGLLRGGTDSVRRVADLRAQAKIERPRTKRPTGNLRERLNEHDPRGADWKASCFPHDRAHDTFQTGEVQEWEENGCRVTARGLMPAADDRGRIMVRNSKPRQYHPSHCNGRGVPTDHQYDETARLAAAIEALGLPTPLPRPVDRSKGPTDWMELEEAGKMRGDGFQVVRNRRREKF